MTVRPRDLIALLIVAVLIAGYGFSRFVLKPEHRQAATLQSQLTTQRATLAQVMRRYTAGHDAELALRRIGSSWRASHEAIPTKSNIPGLLRLLQRETGDVAVGIHEIAVGGGSSTSSDSTSTAPSTAVASTSPGGVNQVPVSFTFDGGYQRLNRLVGRLDALVALHHGRISAHGPFVGISQVSLVPGQGGLVFALTATLYQHGPADTVLGSGADTSS